MGAAKRDKPVFNAGLRISPREQEDLLTELESRTAKQAPSNRRIDERLRYVQQALLFVQMRHPGGTCSNYMVRTRNISKTGIAFLHGAFVYTGTNCTVSLRTANNKSVDVDGKVVRCSHVRGHVHDIGVKFVRPINLREVVGPTAMAVEHEGSVSTEMPKLTGRVLQIDDSTDAQELLKFQLEGLGLAIDAVPNGLDALQLVASVHFDLIIASVWLPGMSGPEIAQALRQEGYKGPIIAVTADERRETRVEALERGCTTLLTKPYPFEALLHVLAQYLPAAHQAERSADVLVSDKWSDVMMRPLIQRFVGRLDGQLRQIQRAIGVAGAEPVIQKLCMDLKGSAGGYGFVRIGNAASGLLNVLLDDPRSDDDVRRQLDALAGLCAAAARGLVDAPAENISRSA